LPESRQLFAKNNLNTREVSGARSIRETKAAFKADMETVHVVCTTERNGQLHE